MISSWGLLAFLKAADTRQGASIAVKDDSGSSKEMFIEDYIAMAEQNGDLPDMQEYEELLRKEQTPPQPVPARRSNLRQGDIEITDFSQLEDDDL